MIGAGSVLIAALPKSAIALSSWNFNPSANQLEVTVKDGIQPRYFLMAQPARIVVDLPDTHLEDVKTPQMYEGTVRQIRISQQPSGMTRIVMELSPDVALAPGQVKLEKLGKQSGETRWALRPLIARTTAVQPESRTTAVQPELGGSISPKPMKPAPLSESAPGAARIEPKPPVTAARTALPESRKLPISPPSIAKPLTEQPPASKLSDTQASEVPDPAIAVHMTGAVAIAVPSAPSSRVNQSPATIVPPPAPSAQPFGTPLPVGIAAPTATPSSPPASAVQTPLPPAVTPAKPQPVSQPTRIEADLTIPSTLPSLSAQAPVSVSVPPLGAIDAADSSHATGSSVPTGDRTLASAPFPPPVEPAITTPTAPPIPTTLPFPAQTERVIVPTLDRNISVAPPPAISAPINPPAMVRVPDRSPPLSSVLDPAIVQSRTAPSGSATVSAPVMEFGQPLPLIPGTSLPQKRPPLPILSESLQSSRLFRPAAPGALLPAGALLSVRYPGATPLTLTTGAPQQEVLMLQTEIRDVHGRVVVPEGSMVTGRFETNDAGSQFIAQSIFIQGRSVPLMAQSENVAGGRRMAEDKLAINSGIGALAGGLLSGLSGGLSGWGVLGGAATGAALTYFTAPRPATIQPGQVFQIRLLDDLR